MWVVFLLLLFPLSVHAEDLGELSANPYNPDSTSNPFGAGSPFKPDGLNNPFSPYGSPFSNQSATNTYATDAPRLYDQQGNYRGKLSANPARWEQRAEGYDQNFEEGQASSALHAALSPAYLCQPDAATRGAGRLRATATWTCEHSIDGGHLRQVVADGKSGGGGSARQPNSGEW